MTDETEKRILEDLTVIKSDLRTVKENTGKRLKVLEGVCFGNGRDGLRIEVDRLNQASKRRNRYVDMAIGAVIAAGVGVIRLGATSDSPAPKAAAQKAPYVRDVVKNRPTDNE